MGGTPPRPPRAKLAGVAKNPCELVINTQLKSPDEDVVILLEIGEFLEIVVLPPGECVALRDGKIAGKIFCLELKELLACIKEGNMYHARVRSVNGVRCAVTIVRQ